MATFYVLYDAFSRSFVAAGRDFGFTPSLNYAKHFTTLWSAENFKKAVHRADTLQNFIIKKIARQ